MSDLVIILERHTECVTSQEHVVVAASLPSMHHDSPPSPMPGGNLHPSTGRDHNHKVWDPRQRDVSLKLFLFQKRLNHALLPNERGIVGPHTPIYLDRLIHSNNHGSTYRTRGGIYKTFK